MTRTIVDDLNRFYAVMSAIAELPLQGRLLRDLPPRKSIPARGVYFFFEPGEFRASTGNVNRVVRVGTHAVSVGSKTTLHARLKAHRGTNVGGGNHRGSIFRRHVGSAMLCRDGKQLPTWGIGSSAPPEVRDNEATRAAERTCENCVSEYLGTMSVLWVSVPDEAGPKSARALIERNSIALLSNQLAPIDLASQTWTGRFSEQQEIRNSGLWNLKHVADSYDPSFLDILELFVKQMALS